MIDKAELKTIARIAKILDKLPNDRAMRVLTYLEDVLVARGTSETRTLTIPDPEAK